MEYKNLKLFLCIAVTSISVDIYSQQEPMFTNYMYNTLAVNPAYAGSREALSITALNRSQWVGFSGAPNSQTITLHTPFKSENVGIGASIINDKIGPIRNTSFFADFAYSIKIDKKSKLAFGVKGGGNLYQANLTTLELDKKDDPSFQNNISNKFQYNGGFGLYYSRPKFYAGASVPKILKSDFKNSSNNTKINTSQPHFFIIAGGVLTINENLEFKPTGYVKLVTSTPIEADLTGSFIINKKLLLGLGYRTGDAFAVLGGYQINDQFYAGYSFDWSYGLKTGKYNFGSHEIMLRYDFLFNNEKRITSPRYF